MYETEYHSIYTNTEFYKTDRLQPIKRNVTKINLQKGGKGAREKGRGRFETKLYKTQTKHYKTDFFKET